MALNEYGVKLDSNGYAPSILNQQPTCLICGRYHTARHEVFYGPYELLTALGYEMADDEKALQNGTHQLFAVYGSGSKADTPCDKCKAAHPECDKCCKTCDDHCNAFQLCRKEYGE